MSYQTVCQTRQKLVPVFGTDFWYTCDWHNNRVTAANALTINAAQ